MKLMTGRRARDAQTPEETSQNPVDDPNPKSGTGPRWTKIAVFGVLPAMCLSLAGIAGYLKWTTSEHAIDSTAQRETVQAASQSAVSLLSYKPDTARKELGEARGLLTGQFRDSYTSLVNDVVVPGAEQKRITADAKVPAAASVSATKTHGVVLLFIDQTVTIGTDAPTETASTVQVTLDKVNGRWLVSGFDPV
jgi:Mce-associated membrane protein